MAAAAQLRTARGRVLGLELGTALALAAARDVDPRAAAELLPAAEVGMLEALAERQGGGEPA